MAKRMTVALRLKAAAKRVRTRAFDYELACERWQRDEFARAALVGGYRSFCQDTTRDVWETYEDFAESCFNMADAMMRERKRRNGK